MSATRAAVLRSYRELLTLIKRLPADQQPAAVQQARTAMQSHRAEQDAARASDLHKQLVARSSFLRMTTTRRPGESSRVGAGTYVLRRGQLVEAEAERASRVADGKVSMEEFKTKHHELLRRQYFGRDPPPGPRIF